MVIKTPPMTLNVFVQTSPNAIIKMYFAEVLKR